MAQQLQLRKGTTAQHAGFVGAIGEVTVDTTKDTLVVHDGSKTGGYPLALESPVATGAVASAARTLSARFAERVNVKDFGAVGDGVTDDAPAIRAAIAYAVGQNNCTVYFPKGNYNLIAVRSLPTGITQSGNRLLYGSTTGYKFTEFFRIDNYSPTTQTFINFEGDQATITSGVWGDVTFAGALDRVVVVTFFQINGYVNYRLNGLKFVNRFGGTNERPVMPEFWGHITNAERTRSGSWHKFLRHDPIGSSTNAWDADLNKPDIVVTNCEFADFGQVFDITYSKTLLIDGNIFKQTVGRNSCGTYVADLNVQIVLRYANESVVVTNNQSDCCVVRDVTPYYTTARPRTLCRISGIDGFIIGDNQCAKQIIVSNNTVKHQAYEALGPFLGDYVQNITPNYTNRTRESVTTITGNVIDGTFPVGTSPRIFNDDPNSNWFGGDYNYGITVGANRPNVVVANNVIRNCSNGILMGGDPNYTWAKTTPDSLICHSNIITFDLPDYLVPDDPDGSFNNCNLQVFAGLLGFDGCPDITVSNNHGVVYKMPRMRVDKTWDGNPSMSNWGNGPACIKSLVSASGSQTNNQKVYWLNNYFECKQRVRPDVHWVSCTNSDSYVFFSNNIVKGVDFFNSRSGGNGGPMVVEKLTFIGGIRLNANEWNEFLIDRQVIPLYLTQTGWYNIDYRTRGSCSGKIKILVGDDSLYGDTVRDGSTVKSAQQTVIDFQFAAGGTDPLLNKVSAVVRNNINSNQCAVSHFGIWFNGSFLQSNFNVNRILTRLKLKIAGGGGSGAQAWATVANGVIQSVTVTNQGSGYTSQPQITVDLFELYPLSQFPAGASVVNQYGIKGSGATFAATLSNGNITAINVTNGGSNYAMPMFLIIENDVLSQFDLPTIPPLNQLFANTPVKVASGNTTWGIQCDLTRSYIDVMEANASHQRIGTGTPLTGTGAPTMIPRYIGQKYIDVSAGKIYEAIGTTASSEFALLN